MKDPIRRAVSLRCRTDRAIDHLCKAKSHFERGALSASELIQEAYEVVNRLEDLKLSDPESPLERSVNRKVSELSCCAQFAAAHALGYESPKQARNAALKFAEIAIRLQTPASAETAHDLLWVTSAGHLSQKEWEAFESCEILCHNKAFKSRR